MSHHWAAGADRAAAAQVQVRVLETSALVQPADVLVLKYAQGLHGVDRRVALTLGLDERTLPPEGGYKIVQNAAGVAAKHVLFVGVPELRSFGYRQIREFVHRGLQIAASELPGAHDVLFTLHGAGYGLDEIEAFESEIAGLLDAVQAGDAPGSLSMVTFAEISGDRVTRMRECLIELLSGSTISTVAPLATANIRVGAADRLRSVGFDSSTRRHALIAMPFEKKFDDYFYFGISLPVRNAGLLCERADSQIFTGDIMEWLKDRIRTATFVIADLTEANPNVYLEIGFAWGCDTPTLLVCHEDTSLLFDVRGQKVFRYSSIKELHDLLDEVIPEILNNKKS